MSKWANRLAFFRQSGWMVFATVAGGALMYAVHKAAGKMDPAELGEKPEYGVFLAMLQTLNLMTIPSIGLQTIVMRQTVAAETDSLQRQLNQALRTLLGGTFLLWLLAVAGVFWFQQDLIASFKIINPAALWLTAAWGLWVLWLPIFMGVLQGRQNFLWMGWVSILGGGIRLVAMIVIVLLLGGQAAGACLAVLIQVVVCALLAGWETRKVWTGPTEKVAWGDWWKRVLPLTIGPGVVTYMMSLDMIVVQKFFPAGETGFYGAAGMIGRALVFLTAPLTAVMFPKVVASAGKSEKSDAMLLALGATALIGGGAALFCTALPSLPLRIIYDASYLKVAWLVPWFAWCMLPLTLGAVLVNNLLARERYSVVVWLVILALGYAGALAWVCKKNSSPLLADRSFTDAPGLASKLRAGADPVAAHFWRQIKPEHHAALAESSPPEEQRRVLAEELNRIIQAGGVYEQQRFAGVTLSAPTAKLLAKQPAGADLVRLNRLLLEEAFPAEVVPSVRGFLPVIQTLGLFGLLLVGVSLWYTVRGSPRQSAGASVPVAAG